VARQTLPPPPAPAPEPEIPVVPPPSTQGWTLSGFAAVRGSLAPAPVYLGGGIALERHFNERWSVSTDLWLEGTRSQTQTGSVLGFVGSTSAVGWLTVGSQALHASVGVGARAGIIRFWGQSDTPLTREDFIQAGWISPIAAVRLWKALGQSSWRLGLEGEGGWVTRPVRGLVLGTPVVRLETGWISGRILFGRHW